MDEMLILKLQQSGAIPPGLTVMEEVDYVRQLKAKLTVQTLPDIPDDVHLELPDASTGETEIAAPEPGIAVPEADIVVGQTVDCSAPPFVPEGWEIRPGDQLASAFRGRLEWDPGRVRLHLADGQRGNTVRGHDLKRELEGQPVLPANALDWLLEEPDGRIPESWKGKRVFFWGTVYRDLDRDRDGDLYVRCLVWDGDCWDWRYRWLVGLWDDDAPAALLASISS